MLAPETKPVDEVPYVLEVQLLPKLRARVGQSFRPDLALSVRWPYLATRARPTSRAQTPSMAKARARGLGPDDCDGGGAGSTCGPPASAEQSSHTCTATTQVATTTSPLAGSARRSVPALRTHAQPCGQGMDTCWRADHTAWSTKCEGWKPRSLMICHHERRALDRARCSASNAGTHRGPEQGLHFRLRRCATEPRPSRRPIVVGHAFSRASGDQNRLDERSAQLLREHVGAPGKADGV